MGRGEAQVAKGIKRDLPVSKPIEYGGVENVGGHLDYLAAGPGHKATLPGLIRHREWQPILPPACSCVLPPPVSSSPACHPAPIARRPAPAGFTRSSTTDSACSRYRSGRSKDWLKFKNPEAPAVKREGW